MVSFFSNRMFLPRSFEIGEADYSEHYGHAVSQKSS